MVAADPPCARSSSDTAKDLAASLALDGSSVVRLLDALETSRLIERREENADRRAKASTISTRGLSIIKQVEAASREVRNGALLELSDGEIVITKHGLELVCQNVTAEQEKDV